MKAVTIKPMGSGLSCQCTDQPTALTIHCMYYTSGTECLSDTTINPIMSGRVLPETISSIPGDCQLFSQ